MAQSRNEILFRRLIDECFNQGKLATADALVAHDFLEHQDFYGALPQHGPAAFKGAVNVLRAIVPDLHITIEDLNVAGDTVWARLIGRGTNSTPFLGRPPTGKPMVIEAVDIVRFRGGKAVEHWGVADIFGCVLQLGFLTPAATA